MGIIGGDYAFAVSGGSTLDLLTFKGALGYAVPLLGRVLRVFEIYEGSIGEV